MTDQDSEAVLRQLAERRADAKIGFWRHALVFVLVNAFLVAINLYYSPHTLWFVWAMGGWGFGLVMHAFAVFAPLSDMREKSIEAEMERLRRRRG